MPITDVEEAEMEQSTRLQYGFVGYGARAKADPRDRPWLARLPQIDEVKFNS
jgi:hypothetical protein